MVGARVLADHEDRPGALDVLEAHGPLADADRLAEAFAARFVTQVRAVREVVGAELAREELPQEGRLVAGAAGGVEDRLVRRVELAQLGGDAREGRVPADRLEVRGARAAQDRLDQPALRLEPVVVVREQLANARAREQLAREPPARRLVRHRLRAVLAELDRAVLARLGPGAAGAIEAARLIHARERLQRRAARPCAGRSAASRRSRTRPPAAPSGSRSSSPSAIAATSAQPFRFGRDHARALAVDVEGARRAGSRSA